VNLEEILKAALQQGLGYGLFVFLLLYVLKTTGEREKNYQITIGKNQDIIQDLSKRLDIVEDIKEDVKDLKNKIN
jgi:hypothetical protein